MISEEKIWQEFLFPEIFEIKKGYYNKKPISSGEGKIPFLSATQFNNGVSEFYTISEIENTSKTGNDKNNHSLEEKIFKGNCIAVTNNGSVGYAFYQKSDFTCSHDINPLYLKNHLLNNYLAKFLIATIEKQRVCFEYARKWRPMRMVKSKILLPVNTKGEPDYEYMESYIKSLEQTKFKDYHKYIQKRIEELKGFQQVKPIDTKEWFEFNIVDIFNPTKGDQNKMSSLLEGSTPLVSAKNGNNGLKAFVSLNKKKIYPKESLTLNNDGDGGAGFSYYQPFTYLLDSHVTSLQPKKEMSKHVLLFISRCITKQRNRFGHGYSINNKRLKAFKIMLPINDKNEPDYEFMENYMKQLEYKKLNEYLKSSLN